MTYQWILCCLIGYLLGAIPTGYIITRILTGIKINEFESSHTGATNVKRAAGLKAAVATAILDVLWGTVSVLIAHMITNNLWIAAGAGAAAIIGHNWSIYIRFKGGIGLSTLFGSLVYFQPLTVAGSALILIILRQMLVKGMRLHRARVTIFGMILFPFVLRLLGLPLEGLLLCIPGVLAVILKTIPDWNRKYE
jgi:glycerol-3-phosphate acyltransferase PlsY